MDVGNLAFKYYSSRSLDFKGWNLLAQHSLPPEYDVRVWISSI